MLQEVSITAELRPGFTQSSYKKPNARSIVLLFDVKKGAVLPNHKHGQHQFGYTFYGEYDFLIDGRRYLAVGRDSYHIQGGIYHSAVARTDYYSMDFKYIGRAFLDVPVSFNLIQTVIDTDGAKRDEVQFDGLSPQRMRTIRLFEGMDYTFEPLAEEMERIMVVSRDASVVVNGHRIPLQKMRIYKVDGHIQKLNVTVHGEGVEAFLYEI